MCDDNHEIVRLKEREREAVSCANIQSKVSKNPKQEKGVTSNPKNGGNDDDETTINVMSRGQKKIAKRDQVHHAITEETARSSFDRFFSFCALCDALKRKEKIGDFDPPKRGSNLL